MDKDKKLDNNKDKVRTRKWITIRKWEKIDFSQSKKVISDEDIDLADHELKVISATT